jgi:hypothetical protein
MAPHFVPIQCIRRHRLQARHETIVNRGFCFTLTDVADIKIRLIMRIAILLKVGALVFGNNPGDITSTFPVFSERTVICTGAHSFQITRKRFLCKQV